MFTAMVTIFVLIMVEIGTFVTFFKSVVQVVVTCDTVVISVFHGYPKQKAGRGKIPWSAGNNPMRSIKT